jgi:hypothetical protein
MSQSTLFIVGAVIFAITVYGSVMAGGLLLTRRELEQNDDRMARLDHEPEPGGLLHIDY